MSEASARILRLLLHCGMIAREEQDIVRALLRTPAEAGLRGRESGLARRESGLAPCPKASGGQSAALPQPR